VNAGVGSVDTEIGNITIFVGNVNVSLGDGSWRFYIQTSLFMITDTICFLLVKIKNVTIGNIFVLVQIGQPDVR
jgi:hypothetical protein